MEKELTKAERFILVAEWLKKQDTDFIKHFKNTISIIEVWNKLPADYNKSRKKITNFIREHSKRRDIVELAMFINAKFDFRYFNNVPKRYSLSFGLNEYRSGKWYVSMKWHDNWTATDGGSSIDIRDIGNAKKAMDNLIEDHKKYHGDDIEIYSIGSRLKDALKKTPKVKEDFGSIAYSITGLSKYGL